MDTMPSLHEAQRAIGRAIVLGDVDGIAALVVGDAISAADRIAIYRNTATGTLLRALRLSYPAVESLVGEEFFEGAARIFIDGCWPRGALLDDYGAEFAGFLADFDAADSIPYLADVARLEWSVHRALHAPDAEPLDLHRLALVPDGQSGQVRFVPDPGLGLISVHWPADEIWHAVIDSDDDAMATIELVSMPRWLLVQRAPAGGIDLQRLSYPQWRLAQALGAGVPLAQALAGTADVDSTFVPEQWLAQLLSAGRFVDFAVDAPTPA